MGLRDRGRMQDTPALYEIGQGCRTTYYSVSGIPLDGGAKAHKWRRLLCGDGNTCVACRDGLDAVTLDPRRAEEEVRFPFLGIGSVGDEDELALSVVHLEGNDILPSTDLYGLAVDASLASLGDAGLILKEVCITISDVL